MNCSVISAVNNEEVLRNCLLNSPDIGGVSELLLQRGFSSAAVAYNAAIDQAAQDLLIFAHQDIYLPEGWFSAVENAVQVLSAVDPQWGVLGCCGVDSAGQCVGYVYDGGWGHIVGSPFEGGIEVQTLDEVVLILRKSSGLRFDAALRGFHMYGADICLEARRRGNKCYAIAALCIHNTNQYRMLPWAFWRGYLAMRRKWNAQLPIQTTCMEITRWCWPMFRWNVVRAVNLAIGRDNPPTQRVQDPAKVYAQLLSSGRIASAMPAVSAGQST